MIRSKDLNGFTRLILSLNLLGDMRGFYFKVGGVHPCRLFDPPLPPTGGDKKHKFFRVMFRKGAEVD